MERREPGLTEERTTGFLQEKCRAIQVPTQDPICAFGIFTQDSEREDSKK